MWIEEVADGVTWFRPDGAPPGVTIAFSGRGHAPEGEISPTPFLARRLAGALGLGAMPVFWGNQVHGAAAAVVRESAPSGQTSCVGEGDALVSDRAGIALVVQTADCVPILLASGEAVAAAHAGWRGSARGVAGAAVGALRGVGVDPASLRCWLGPSIGPCCYEVGGEVAAQFAGDFVRTGCGGSFRLDLAGANVSQLEAAGVPPGNIAAYSGCTRCGGERFASYRRDGVRAGRMIALIARLPAGAHGHAGVRSA